MNWIRMFFWASVFASGLAGPARGSTFDLATGAPGTVVAAQAFNNATHGVDVTVNGASNWDVGSMTLVGINLASAGVVGARIYESSPPFLIASAQMTVSTGSNLTVTVPISAALISGRSYRLCFFVSYSVNPSSASMFDPAPSGVGGFPYIESSGALTVNQAWSSVGDTFPTTSESLVQLIRLEVCPTPTSVDLYSGTTGTLTTQFFSNETRGCEIALNAACSSLVVNSITLYQYSITTPSGTLAARIYDSTSGTLIASAQRTVTTGNDLSTTLPISADLTSGGHYRVCFFISVSGSGATARLFDPTPSGAPGFPYTDATGTLEIVHGYGGSGDAFPPGANAFLPRMTLHTASSRNIEFCSGDGVDPALTTSCPCGNVGALHNGCASSFNAAGAHLTAAGNSDFNSIVLMGSGMQLAGGPCIFLQSDDIDPNAHQFGDGITCARGLLLRLRTVFLSNGSASFPVPPETISLSARGGVSPGSGAIRAYTAYYRNAASTFCTAFTFNATNGYRIVW